MKSLTLHAASQLPAHLKSLRKARHLTQAQLGAKLGLDQTRIARIERDPSVVSVGQLLQLLSALQVRIVLDPTPDAKPSTRLANW
jgi:HTH-type transcriptional regulator / antitoxin HipB